VGHAYDTKVHPELRCQQGHPVAWSWRQQRPADSSDHGLLFITMNDCTVALRQAGERGLGAGQNRSDPPPRTQAVDQNTKVGPKHVLCG